MNNMTQSICMTAKRLAFLLACALALTGTHTTAIAVDDPDADQPGAGRGAGFRVGMESFQAEFAGLPEHAVADRTAALRLRWVMSLKTSPGLELRAGLRTDLDHQAGIASVNETHAALTDSYLRWRLGEARLTVGLQTVLWGRVDAVSLIDRVARVDLRRFALDELKDRRLPQPALRWEHAWGDYQSDLVLLAGHLSTLLPQANSAWHPVNRHRAQILGTAAVPSLAGFYGKAPLQTDDHDFGGAALRLTHTGDGMDQGFTIGRLRQNLPFFEIDVNTPAIRASNPFNHFLAADLELVSESVTWRAEVAHTWDVPMTSANNGKRLKANSLEFAGGAEFFPGGRDTRVNLQLLLRTVRVGEATVELKRYASLSGEIETTFSQGKFKAALRFASALNISDAYLSPRLSYVGWEPHEIYMVGHVFRGGQRGFGGFFRDTSNLAIGIKTRF